MTGYSNRIEWIESLTTTVYLGNLVEIAIGPSGRITTTHYYLGGKRIALRRGGAVTYLHADHLGSTSLATNGSGLAMSGSRKRPVWDCAEVSRQVDQNT